MPDIMGVEIRAYDLLKEISDKQTEKQIGFIDATMELYNEAKTKSDSLLEDIYTWAGIFREEYVSKEIVNGLAELVESLYCYYLHTDKVERLKQILE